jgi:DNA-binding GntR family transcriptional regulator
MRSEGGGTAVLAERIAASLVHREPGWRLPRQSALARRYNVSVTEVSAAADELIARHLVRRLPDGQLYRATPAEYRVPLAGVAGLDCYADPMGGPLRCDSQQVSWRRAPEEIESALRIGHGELVRVVRVRWVTGSEPAASCTAYLRRELDSPLTGPAPAVTALPLTRLSAWRVSDGAGRSAVRAAALQVEMQPPPPAAARSLRLAVGQPAALVCVRFDEPGHNPVAVTLAVLRPEEFRIVIESAGAPVADGQDPACASRRPAAASPEAESIRFPWTAAAPDWEP